MLASFTFTTTLALPVPFVCGLNSSFCVDAHDSFFRVGRDHHVAVLHGRPNDLAQLQCERQQRGHGAYFEFAPSVAEAALQRRWVERDIYDLFSGYTDLHVLLVLLTVPTVWT